MGHQPLRSAHVFLDESVRDSYLICAVLVRPSDLDRVRRLLRQLRLGGQRRLHFERERDARRRMILTRLIAAPLRASIFTCEAGDQVTARLACLRRVVIELGEQTRRLVIESSESLEARDRQAIYNAMRTTQLIGAFDYEHLRSFEEPMLWAADAICWAHGAGGDWRKRVEAVIDNVYEVRPPDPQRRKRKTRIPTVR